MRPSILNLSCLSVWSVYEKNETYIHMYLGDMFMYLPICFCVKFGAYTIVRYIILYLHILQPLTNSASGRTLNFFGCWVRARALDGHPREKKSLTLFLAGHLRSKGCFFTKHSDHLVTKLVDTSRMWPNDKLGEFFLIKTIKLGDNLMCFISKPGETLMGRFETSWTHVVKPRNQHKGKESCLCYGRMVSSTTSTITIL